MLPRAHAPPSLALLRACTLAGPGVARARSALLPHPPTPRSAVAAHDARKVPVTGSGPRLGGRYDVDASSSFEVGGAGGVMPESLGAVPLRKSRIVVGTAKRDDEGRIVNAVVIPYHHSGGSISVHEHWVVGAALSWAAAIGPGRLIDAERPHAVMFDAAGLRGASMPSDGVGMCFPRMAVPDLPHHGKSGLPNLGREPVSALRNLAITGFGVRLARRIEHSRGGRCVGGLALAWPQGVQMMLGGERDGRAPAADMKAKAAAMPRRRLVVVPGGGHPMNLERPVFHAEYVGASFGGFARPSWRRRGGTVGAPMEPSAGRRATAAGPTAQTDMRHLPEDIP